ncbi:hypothetical protein PROFUN_00639 [Planoprotostelium fungivorum]|uniref:Uncharacterized protein n=1 Tax=Planoprotostelium fungivorum TaxID=1890364 RepID=A0A2P6NU83_9EUKA|nr:hypothetical protein PROFUN_00639 [Planoprotostelium fungivorum]
MTHHHFQTATSTLVMRCCDIVTNNLIIQTRAASKSVAVTKIAPLDSVLPVFVPAFVVATESPKLVKI